MIFDRSAMLPAMRAHCLVLPLLLASQGCNEPASDAEAAPTPGAIVARHRAMLEAVAATMETPRVFSDGSWHEHYGDGLMFGPAWDLATWARTGEERHRARALQVLEANVAKADAAAADLLGALDDLEAVAMALLGLLEAGQFVAVPAHVEAAERLLEPVDAFAAALGDYLEITAGEFAATTYGPTAISSLVALAHLELALAWPEREAAAHVARAREVLDHIGDRVWDVEAGRYRFAPDDERLMLYPNATLMVAHARALQLSGDAVHADRVAAIWEGIQGLRAAGGDHYHSPYSRAEADAIDEDYATLSSQNYMMMALWLAWKGTGERRYLEDLTLILGWIESHLFVDGVLKHHWVNGRVADESDLYDFCSGCNLQTLYIASLIEAGS